MNIVQFGIPRSGSTLITQIMREVLKQHIKKVHHYSEGNFFVCSYRDFRDTAISHWRTKAAQNLKRKITREEIDTEFDKLKTHIESLNKYKGTKSNKIAYLRYEDFYNDYSVIYNTLEGLFGVKIEQKERESLTKKYSFDKNLERSKKFKDFSEWDSTGIHGGHLYKGKVGTWREFVSQKDIDYFNNSLKNFF